MANFNGTNANDVYVGTTESDFIRGNEGDDILKGEGGNDTIFGGTGNDELHGGDDDDQLRGEDGDDIMFGGAGSDFFRGGAGVDAFHGGTENPSSTTFGSGTFGDRISFYEPSATAGVIADLRTGIIENDGFGNREVMTGIESLGGATAFADFFYGDDRRNLLIAGAGDTMMGYGGDDAFQVGGAPAILDGGEGNDLLVLTSGGDLIPNPIPGGLAITGPEMTEGWVIDLALGTIADGFGQLGQIIGIEAIQGSVLGDVLRGDEAANEFIGGGGNDVLDGRGGNDRLQALSGSDTIDGGEGIDTVVYGSSDPFSYSYAAQAVHVDLKLGYAEEVEANIETTESSGRVDYSPGSGTISDGSTRTARDTVVGVENIVGTGLGDRLYGDDLNNIISPGAGDDIVDGRGGIDTIDYSSSRGAMTINLADGFSVQAASGAAVSVYFEFGPNGQVMKVVQADDNRVARDQLLNIENVIGSNLDDVIIGDHLSNVLNGGSGNDRLEGGVGDDVLDGGAGADAMFGGAGNDVYFYNYSWDGTAGDSIYEAVGEGIDEVRTTVSTGIDWMGEIENLTGLGTAGIFLGGNALDNVIKGNAGNNHIRGEGGNDTIDGGAGKDAALFALPAGTLGSIRWVEGTGADAGKLLVQLVNGNDVQTWAKVTVSGVGSAIVQGVGLGEAIGTDTLNNIEELHFFVDGNNNPATQHRTINLAPVQYGEFVAGGEAGDTINLAAYPGALNTNAGGGDDTIVGTGADNYIEGGSGNDVIDGGDSGRDVASFNLPEGTPGSYRLVDGSGVNAGKLVVQRVDGSAVEDLFVITVTGPGSAAVTGINSAAHFGTDTVTNVEQLHFRPYGDFDQNKFLAVNLAPYVPGPNDFPHVTGGEAADAIDLAALYPATPASTDINANGNRGNDTISGHEGRNFIAGDAGNDTLYGRGGDDSLVGGLGDDIIDGGAGIDAAQFMLPRGTTGTLSSVFMADGTTLILLTQTNGAVEAIFKVTVNLGGTTTVQGLGSAAGYGTDTVTNTENLHFFVESWPDPTPPGQFAGLSLRVTQSGIQVNGSTGSDTINLADYPGAVNVFAGAGNDHVTGTEGPNLLQGGPGSDTIFGGAGNDTLVGGYNQGASAQPGDGADSLHGGAGNDMLRGGDGDDLLEGDDGDDNLRGDAGNDTVDGGAGTDFVSYRFDDFVTSGVVFDASGFAASLEFTMSDGRGGIDTLRNVETLGVTGSNFDDTIRGSMHSVGVADSHWANQISGNGGNDQIYGGNSLDILWGGDGNDTVIGNAGNDVLFGDAGNDTLNGGDGDDYLEGGAGDDTLEGAEGIDKAGFSGAKSNYRVEKVDGKLLVTDLRAGSPDGKDTLIDIEKLVFSDGELDVASLRFGVASDGYISGGTVFIDVNGDGILQKDSEPWTFTNAQGTFTLVSDAVGTLIVTGGINLDTGLPNQIVMKAPSGSTVVNPLTTLVQKVVEQSSTPVTAAEAEAQVKSALGISNDVSLLQTDLIAAASATATTPEEAATKAAALDAQKTAAAVVSVIVAAKEAGGSAGETAALSGLTNVIVGTSQDDPKVDLTKTETLQAVLRDAVPASTLEEIVQSVKVETTQIANSTSLTEIAQAQATGALTGNSQNNNLVGGDADDIFQLQQGGDDTASGGAGNDFFYFGGAYTVADQVDGGEGTDTLGLHGVYNGLAFTATSLTGIERIALYSSSAIGAAGPFSYSITTHDGNVASGGSLFVTAAGLRANETLTFIGSAEKDGAFRVQGGAGADLIVGGDKADYLIGNGGNDQLFGGGGDDYLVGGAGQDHLRGGAGFDTFRFLAASDSTVAAPDRIIDFQLGEKIDLSAIDANSMMDGDQAFTFIGNAAFAGVAGQLRAAYDAGTKLWSVEGDINGDGQADFLIMVSRPVSDMPILAGEFHL